jgi:tetratricopeptide (TPR) repeat protein
MGKVDDAIGEFRLALRHEPGLSLAAYNLGLALESKGHRDEALTAWESFLKVSGNKSEGDEWTPKIREGLSRLRTAMAPGGAAAVVTSAKQ